MKTELAALEKIIKEVKDLEKDKKMVEGRIEVIEGLINNQAHLSRILGEYSASLMDEVWIDNLSLSANQTFDFTAHTFNNYLIAKYMVTLKDDPTFDNIELSYVRKSKIKEEDRDVEIVSFRLSGLFIPKRLE
jgi:Tfp pilus assembly protein PilN